MTYFVVALAMVLGFTQCKKEQTPANGKEGVRITLNVDKGANSPKVIVDPTGHTNPDYATVSFEAGDVIYVGYNNQYVGTLTCSDGSFSGTVSIEASDIVEGEHLHFYFLGGVGFEPTVDGNTATVVISDQTQKLPVISYAPSNEVFNGEGSYSAKLMNKCSIMKFNVTAPDAVSNDPIFIAGMNNKVTVHFDTPNTVDNGFEYGRDGQGLIKLPSVATESTETWVIVLPQAEVTNAKAIIMAYGGTVDFTVPAITSNKYYSVGVDVPTISEYYFTVNSDGKKVLFAPGNLQYQASTQTWRFAEHQYDRIGNDNSNISPSYSGWIDLFGWGTWTGDDPNPTLTDEYNSWEESGWDDWEDWKGNRGTLKSNYDWGAGDFKKEAALADPSQQNYDWYTLNGDEWLYVFWKGEVSYYRRGKVNGIDGVFVRPDNSIWPSVFNTTNGEVTAEQFAQAEEDAGIIFLPAARYRNGTNVADVNNGYYWSSSYNDQIIVISDSPPTQRKVGQAYYISFDNSYLGLSFGEGDNPNCQYGYSVRLVRNAN